MKTLVPNTMRIERGNDIVRVYSDVDTGKKIIPNVMIWMVSELDTRMRNDEAVIDYATRWFKFQMGEWK